MELLGRFYSHASDPPDEDGREVEEDAPPPPAVAVDAREDVVGDGAPAEEDPSTAEAMGQEEEDAATAAPAAADDACKDDVDDADASSTKEPSPDEEKPAAGAEAGVGPAVVGVSKNRIKDASKTSSAKRFSDFGECGFYLGDLREVDGKSQRHGRGRMAYDSGNSYSGPFADDKFHGQKGIYNWADGDEQEGSWEGGKRHGPSVFRAADGLVEYSSYEKGKAKGEGVTWTADRKTAHKMVDGRKTAEISLEEAEKLAKDLFDLPVPAPSKAKVGSAKTTAEEPVVAMPAGKALGLLERYFSSRKVGPGGVLLFKDHGEWGTFEGDIDALGNRQGTGKMTYESGAYYDGGFLDGKFHGGDGIYKWADGDEYSGAWAEGERHGVGLFKKADGSVEISEYDKGQPKGDGVAWSPDRTKAYRVSGGGKGKRSAISLGVAEKLMKDKFDMAVPEPFVAATGKAVPASENLGFLRRLFATRRAGPDGKLQLYEHGEWGTYEGDLDSDGNRQGHGKMTYESGNTYEGGFLNDKFHSDNGTYLWEDGDEYSGAWADGERHGVGVFHRGDGGVQISKYEKGQATGEGVTWSVDRKTAHRMFDGREGGEISTGMAEKLAWDKFGLPVPAPREVPPPGAARGKSVGFLGRWFQTRKVDPDGKTLYKDNGEWGMYTGDRDAAGNRHGRGKMTYKSGSRYEGEFLNDKYHGDKGIYRWADGDEYEGPWRDGERHGTGIFRRADGAVDYSEYDRGSQVRDGVSWSADRGKAFKTVWGKVKNEISLGMAEKVARDKFDLPVPAPFEASPLSAVTPSASRGRNVGFLKSLFSNRKLGPNGELLFKDYGEWGTYEGEVDSDGNRVGWGTMSYDSANRYEGGFANDKFDGPDGTYHWHDGDEYSGEWKQGERHGRGVFRSADGSVEYSHYERGQAKGEGIWWSADRETAQSLSDGEKKMELLVEEAAALAKEKFNLPVPEARKDASPAVAAPSAAPSAGFLQRLFRSGEDGVVGPNGKIQFKDYGDWGTYEGEFDDSSPGAAGSRRHGRGKMNYASGNFYEGPFVDNKYHGQHGTYRWADGDEYFGSWFEGERQGIGVFRTADGAVEYSAYQKGQAKGDGIWWSANRQTAHIMVEGEKTCEISLEEAKKMAREVFDLPVLEQTQVSSSPLSKPLLLGTLFKSKENGSIPDRKEGPRFEDFGDMGTFEGELLDGLRREGKMSYDSGNSYEGEFSNGKFDGLRGLYRWSDGTEYEGSWKEGSFNGIGIFRSVDGSVDYSVYKDGYATGVGALWTDGYTKAYRTLDGVKMEETSLAEVEKLAKEKFGLPAPSLKPRLGIASSLGRIFRQKRIGTDGKLEFKDYGIWGTYKGDLDASGQRHGRGNMTYECGNFYAGGFVDDKYHCDKGVYRWSDGDEYEGSWKDGERHGIGIFRNADGSASYSMYEKGSCVGNGVAWSADRKTAYKTEDGEKKNEISLNMAEKLAQEKFDLSVPDQTFKVASQYSPASVKSIGFFGRLFSNRKIGPGGRTFYKDHGDWGLYEGKVDEAGNRQGSGKMTYESGNYYEGEFVNDKFECDKGRYRWFDGDEYFGQWKDGERHGKGSFKNKDGSVEYSFFEKGQAKGNGVSLSSDQTTAHSLLDGEKTLEMLMEEAESLIQEKFNSLA